MTRLVLNGNEIDLYENDPVSLNLQYSDISDIAKAKSSFSQTFRVPLTSNNENFFGGVGNAQSLTSNWNSKTKITAELYDGSLLIISGYAQVKNIYIQKGSYVDVELAVFGEIANLSKEIGDAFLSDLDLSSYNHALTYSNQQNSWAGTSASPFNGTIRYGIVDRGQNWTGNDAWVTPRLEVNDLTPFIRVKTILDEILSDAGFVYTSSWMSSMSDMYLMCNSGGKNVITSDGAGVDLFAVGLTVNTAISGHSSITTLQLYETGNFYDIGGNVSSGIFTAPVDGSYQFSFTFTLASIVHTGNLAMYFMKNNVADQTIVDLPVTTIGTNTGTIATYNTFLSANDTVKIGYQFSDSSTSAVLIGNGGTFLPNTVFTCNDISVSEGTVVMSDQMPKMKQIDFLQSLKSAFNLLFIPDKLNPKHLTIEPYDTYMGTSSVKDWTEKVDYSKDVTISPTTDAQAKIYDWNLSLGLDIANQVTKLATDRVYGRYRIDDSGNDFGNGNKEVKTGFAPYITSLVPETGFIIHRCITDKQGDAAVIEEPLAKLAFWNGQVSSSFFNIAGNSQTSYPVLSVYENAPLDIDATDDQLLFGYERPFHPYAGNPLNAMYYKYYRNYVNQLYGADSRRAEMSIALNPVDINTFEWSDRIFIKDTYYRVLSISNYVPSETQSVKVKLLKIIGDVRDCRWLPHSFDKDGRVQFEDSDGGLDYQVTEECCTKYGHRFDNNTSFCYREVYIRRT